MTRNAGKRKTVAKRGKLKVSKSALRPKTLELFGKIIFDLECLRNY